ncbi:MAG: TIM barrel protein [Clostridiales bacterium]|nr:TIM barrel protein [Clostridiales bacterium]
MKMKYSVCVDAVFENKGTFTEAMKKIKETGYNAVEFWSWWDKDVCEISRAQQELELEIAAFCTKFVNPGDQSLQEQYLEGLAQSIETAKELECGTLITQAGWNFESALRGITEKEHRSSLLETMKRGAELVEKADMTLVVEPLNLLVNHPGYHLSTSEDAFDVIDRIGSPKVKVLFDIYHQQITEGNLIANITENIGKIGHFHAAGNPGRTEITKGEIHYKHVFEEISRLGYDGYIGLEYMTKEDPVSELVRAKKEVLV